MMWSKCLKDHCYLKIAAFLVKLFGSLKIFCYQNFIFKDLQGQFLLNGLDITTDFMRYSENNFVTGLKILNNVHAKTLHMERKHNVKGVDLLTWIYRSILNDGNSLIEYPVVFNNVTIFKSHLA